MYSSPSLGHRVQRTWLIAIISALIISCGQVDEPTNSDAGSADAAAVGDSAQAGDASGAEDSGIIADTSADTSTGVDTSIPEDVINDAGGDNPDTVDSDTSTGPDAGSDVDDAGVDDGGSSDAVTGDVASGDAVSGDANADGGADSAVSADVGPTLSCQGSLNCKMFEGAKMKSCATTKGCFAKGFKCTAAAGGASATCDKLTTSQACAADAQCLWAPTTCVGFVHPIAGQPQCSDSATAAACGQNKGCKWTECLPTGDGVEVCDGLDNDCNGLTDDGLVTGKETIVVKTSVCEDGDVCVTGRKCIAGKCSAGAPVTCAAKSCYTGTCDKTKGCVWAANDGATCDDGDLCTLKDTCAGGSCVAGAPKSCDGPCHSAKCDSKTGACGAKVPKSCDDSNACTKDSCDPTKGCVNANMDGQACGDGDKCVTGATCSGGKCGGGAQVNCDDSNACTKDSCDPAVGCKNAPTAENQPCGAGDKCVSNAVCKAGKCTGSTKSCNDNNPCTVDSCDATTGACKNVGDGCGWKGIVYQAPNSQYFESSSIGADMNPKTGEVDVAVVTSGAVMISRYAKDGKKVKATKKLSAKKIFFGRVYRMHGTYGLVAGQGNFDASASNTTGFMTLVNSKLSEQWSRWHLHPKEMTQWAWAHDVNVTHGLGHVVVCGKGSTVKKNPYVFVSRHNFSNGSKGWAKEFPAKNFDANGVHGSGKGIYVVGTVFNSDIDGLGPAQPVGGHDIWVRRLSVSNGSTLKTYQLGSTGKDVGRKILYDGKSNKLWLLGEVAGSVGNAKGIGGQDIFLTELDQVNLTPLKSIMLGTTQTDKAGAFDTDNQGRVWVVGTQGTNTVYLARVSADAKLEVEKTWTATGGSALGMVVTAIAGGDILIGGRTNKAFPGLPKPPGHASFLMRANSAGVLYK